MKIGILLFNDVEELDFVGPWEVFKMVARGKARCHRAFVSVGKRRPCPFAAAECGYLPDTTTSACDSLDVLLVPGGAGDSHRGQERGLCLHGSHGSLPPPSG